VVDAEQLIGLHGAHAEVDFVNPLAEALRHLHVLDVVGLVRRVHHRGYVVDVPLLRHAGVHANVALAKRIDLECHLEFARGRKVLYRYLVMINYCLDGVFVQICLEVEVFELLLSLRHASVDLLHVASR